jgi:hypothetical protein
MAAADPCGGIVRGMVVSGVRQRAGRVRRANGPEFDLFTAKLRRPLLRPGVVRRSLLINRKLGASTRSQAVTQARELGLLDG